MTNPDADEDSAGSPEDTGRREHADDATIGGPAEAQGLNDDDQSLADADQTRADADQSAADIDQQASDDDRMAAADDQAASDRDLAEGGDPGVHQTSEDIRNRSSGRRVQGSQVRTDSSTVREAAADARDLAAAARDQVSDLLDHDLEALDAEWSAEAGSGSPPRSEDRARASRDRVVQARAAAAEARARAAADRRKAAQDRRRAAGDRRESQREHASLRSRLSLAETDGLTGARARAPGLEELGHEIDRARRTTSPLTVAFVDVIGLKRVNDTRGHAAGDALLTEVVRVLRSHLRSYDGIVRVGGDEFVCVMSGAPMASARGRFESIRTASIDAGCGVKFGIAELRAEEDGAALIDRADQAVPPSPPRVR